MGQSHSTPESRDVPIEQLAHELALKFAEKCYSHLEIAHFKDNFKTLADHKDDIEYWKEETLCQFFCLPESIGAGPVLYQMATYLGSFPFPSLAPCILTREAMLKIVTILTGRYKKVLKQGDQDKNKLLFRSLAVFDRRLSMASPNADVLVHEDGNADQVSTGNTGFAVDDSAHDDEEEDDDDLTLAALDSLDAIEVFKEDQKKEKKLSRAHIPVANFEKLVMVLLLLAPLTPQDNIASFSGSLDENRLQELSRAAKSIVAVFTVDDADGAITYSSFMKTLALMPNLFRPLGPLFEHFLFSKNIDLSKHKDPSTALPKEKTGDLKKSPIHLPVDASKADILNDIILAQLAVSFEIGTISSPESSSFFHLQTRFDEIYSTSSHGTSLSSFSRQVVSWKSPTLLLMSGSTPSSAEPVVFGAYLPEAWKENVSQPPTTETASSAVLFQLRPQHAMFRANKYNRTAPLSYFSSRSGVALGCIIPTQSRLQAQFQKPVLGPVSIFIDDGLSTATFQHDGNAGSGAFVTDPRLEEKQRSASKAHADVQPKKIEIQIDAIEIWGISFSGSGEDAIESQKRQLAWEEKEAERRKGVNFGGDKDGARHLLEMAGIVGQNQSGGSV